MRERTLDGYFWLPQRPDEKIAGIVTYDGTDRPQLRLIGAFTSGDEQLPVGIGLPQEHLPLVLGRCEGEEVSLVDCYAIFTSRATCIEDSRLTLAARLMLVGIWLDRPDEQCFDCIVVGIDHLLAWSRLSALSQDGDRVGGRQKFTARWEKPQPLTADVPGGAIELRVECTPAHESWADRNERSLEEHAYFAVTVPELQSAQALITAWPKVFQDLLTLAIGEACGVHRITLIRQNPPQEPEDEAPPRALEVEAYLAPIYRSRPDDRATRQALFTLDRVPFADLMPTWLSVRERLGPVSAMLLGPFYMDRSYAENRLITAVAAAEALHRRLLREKSYVSAEQFETLMTAAVNAVPDEHREWLAARIRNEPSLNRRLVQLVKRLGNDLVRPFMPRPDRWATASKEARNLLVHRFEGEPPIPMPLGDGSVMYVLAAMTSAVVTLSVLKEIGVDPMHLMHVAGSHSSFQWIAEEGRSHTPWLFEEPTNHRG